MLVNQSYRSKNYPLITTYHHPKVNFGSTIFSSTNEQKESQTKTATLHHYTSLFRGNEFFQWTKLVDSMIKKFPNGAKIHCYACSDGSEPYTLAMLLIDKLGEEEAAKKFFPILAKDISNNIINKAKSGIIEMNRDDIQAIKSNIKFATPDDLFCKQGKVDISEEEEKGFFLDRELDAFDQPSIIGFNNYKVSDILRKCVKFEVADITKEAQNKELLKDSKPNIILFRNALYLLPNDKARETLINNLSDNMQEGDLFVINNWDLWNFEDKKILFKKFNTLDFDFNKITKLLPERILDNVKTFFNIIFGASIFTLRGCIFEKSSSQ